MKRMTSLMAILMATQLLFSGMAKAQDEEGILTREEVVAMLIQGLDEVRSQGLSMAYQADQASQMIKEGSKNGTLNDVQLNEIYERFFKDSDNE